MKPSYLLIVVLCLTNASCNSQKEPETIAPREVIHPIVKDTTYSREYVAEIHSVKHVEVRSKIKGYIERIHVDEGQRVKEGQLLFTLNSLELEKELQKATAAHRSAQADLKAAEVDLRNVTRLVEKNIVSEPELAVTKARVDALKADVEEAAAHKDQAVLNLSFSQIRAPYNGLINRIPNKAGSLIAEGDMLTSISDNREVFAYFNLSEIEYLNYLANEKKEARSVNLKLANNSLYAHPGKIEMIESEFDSATGNIAFRARFPNPDGILKHGSNAKVIVSEPVHNALFIPQKSTFEIQDKLYVFVIDREGILRQRNVVPKMRVPDFYIVESGLSQEEKIVFEGVENMKDGDRIQPIDADPAAVVLSNGRS
jgi:membrane fusion protein (multidrug efflux system)